MSTLGKYLKVSIQHAVLSNGEWNSLINFNVLILRVMQPGREEEEKRILSLPLQNLKTYTKIETIRELLGFFCELITPIILASSEKPSFMSSSFFFCFFLLFFSFLFFIAGFRKSKLLLSSSYYTLLLFWRDCDFFCHESATFLCIMFSSCVYIGRRIIWVDAQPVFSPLIHFSLLKLLAWTVLSFCVFIIQIKFCTNILCLFVKQRFWRNMQKFSLISNFLQFR